MNVEVCDVGKERFTRAQECYAEHESLVVQAPFLDAFWVVFVTLCWLPGFMQLLGQLTVAGEVADETFASGSSSLSVHWVSSGLRFR